MTTTAMTTFPNEKIEKWRGTTKLKLFIPNLRVVAIKKNKKNFNINNSPPSCKRGNGEKNLQIVKKD